MTHRIDIDSTTLIVSPIERVGQETRRQAEIRTVAEIVRGHLGDGVNITHDEDGAPHIQGCNISVTHSRRLAAVAFDPVRRIGIDAEEWRDTIDRVSSRYLSDSELKIFTTDRQKLKAWTIKEAVYKIVGSVAVDFVHAISIAPDMQTVESDGETYAISSCDFGDTIITLAH